MVDLQARAVPELHGLARQRERAGNQRLGGNDGGGGGERDQREQRPLGREQEERLRGRRAVGQQQRALPEVVQQQRRQHQPKPGQADRLFAEVSHVGVQRLSAGDYEEHRAQHRKSVEPMLGEERDRVPRVEGGKDDGLANGPDNAQHREHNKPENHHGAEEAPDAVGAMPLNREDADEDGDGRRHDIGIEQGRSHLQPFHGSQHGDGRSDHAVTIEQGGAKDAQQDQDPAHAVAGVPLRQQRGQRQDAAFALVVGAKHDRHVLDRDDQHQRVDDQRQYAEHVGLGRRYGMGAEKTLAHRVEGTGTDVAINDTERRDGEGYDRTNRRRGCRHKASNRRRG